FFEALRQRTGNKQLVLLLDEFPLLVAQHTADLLDLLRFIHRSNRALFIMSGRQHPDLLSRACPETALFPLRDHEVGFLSDAAVSRVLHEPVSGYELTLPPATVQRVFTTSGHA